MLNICLEHTHTHTQSRFKINEEIRVCKSKAESPSWKRISPKKANLAVKKGARRPQPRGSRTRSAQELRRRHRSHGSRWGRRSRLGAATSFFFFFFNGRMERNATKQQIPGSWRKSAPWDARPRSPRGRPRAAPRTDQGARTPRAVPAAGIRRHAPPPHATPGLAPRPARPFRNPTCPPRSMRMEKR